MKLPFLPLAAAFSLATAASAAVSETEAARLGRDLTPQIERILNDASNYYVLGYWPQPSSSGLHRVEVKVRAKGARVHARLAR